MKRLIGRFVVIEAEDIDTDQIIPARFLTVTSREGLGEGLFADWRHDAAGEPRADFALNRPEANGAEVLVAGRNFGCGSSREHAAWALAENGFRVVISTEIADIFRSNALKNGMLPVVVPDHVHARLVAQGTGSVEIDVEQQILRLDDVPDDGPDDVPDDGPDDGADDGTDDGIEVAFALDPFAKYCLINGVDELGFLLQQEDDIRSFEEAAAEEAAVEVAAPGSGADVDAGAGARS
jgi:3-isopropylmalate/(R)-2-methylmalate dehydratase small subunit